MFKKIIIILLLFHLALIILSGFINHQLQAYTWQEASEQTKDNKILKLEGKYRVFSSDFEEGRNWYTTVGQYNYLDQFLWENYSELLSIRIDQNEAYANFITQYTHKKIELEALYETNKYEYYQKEIRAIEESLVIEDYVATKALLIEKFEATEGRVLQQQLVTLDKEMEEFKAYLKPTLI